MDTLGVIGTLMVLALVVGGLGVMAIGKQIPGVSRGRVGSPHEDDPAARTAEAVLGNVISIDQGGYGVVERVMKHDARVTPITQHTWYLRASEPDDVVVEWLPHTGGGTGGTLRVSRAIGTADGPLGHREWRRLLDTVERVSSESGRFYSRTLGRPLIRSDEAMPGLIVWVAPSP